ncbi:MAG: hypothetical protein WBQ94_09985, partial [Terracidiphilus sp.]
PNVAYFRGVGVCYFVRVDSGEMGVRVSCMQQFCASEADFSAMISRGDLARRVLYATKQNKIQ